MTRPLSLPWPLIGLLVTILGGVLGFWVRAEVRFARLEDHYGALETQMTKVQTQMDLIEQYNRFEETQPNRRTGRHR